jgi:pyruvate/2-oxoglutarate dehydrogenase complex dihydrolipoamide dehydrogenase (E3) component
VSRRAGDGPYDIVVIGAGTAGLVTAAAAAGLGARVALVERGRMGGDCLNTGCVPSKALISSARLVARMRRAAEWGLETAEPRFSFEKVFARMRQRREKIAPHDSQERLEAAGVAVFRGTAKFVSPREIVVENRRLAAKRFVIATGGRPALPPVEGLSDVSFFTNETVFDELMSRPPRLAILGGGPIGCELGQVFARLDVKVTILQRAERLLEREDADASDVVRRALETDGVRIATGADVRRAARAGGGVRLELAGGEAIEAEALLVASGRAPNCEGLGLEEAGVAYTKKGITVDSFLRTSQRHIYAAGDVAGLGQFTHLAEQHARTIVRNILVPWPKARADRALLPWCTYTDPELARVGLSEEDARRGEIAVDVFRFELSDLDRAIVESEEKGFVKILTAKGKDRILGATIVGERAGDVIAEIVLAMQAGVGLSTISETVHAYPTFAEGNRRAADVRVRSRLTPVARRLLALRWGHS